ncbi:hypothetical protein RhiirB3_454947 [Rhizophagus irregularis]|nr:hypothetical protein RhiirB3_454947 [Rhizophagus irregularis]
MRATDSSIGIGSLLTDRAYCSRMGIKMSGTSFRTSAPFPTNQTISLDVLADKTTYTRLDDPYKIFKNAILSVGHIFWDIIEEMVMQSAWFGEPQPGGIFFSN